jgi:hypothetical protein
MLTVIVHLFFGIIQRFFLWIGGIARWLLFQIYNECFTERFPRNIDYYIDNESNIKDKNGFSVQNKNFFSGLIVTILIIILLDKFENK